ncbi:MAG: chemotaxis protein CheW [Nitrosomonadales bacterium]|nr:chemotaxis protein CheW [Nitrosomonadales bacterium]
MGAIVRAEQRTEAASVEEGQSQYLTFLLGGEMFAIPILNIKEIIEYGSLTTVPMMPAFIRGVINLRGNVVPVVDLSVRFGRKAAAVTKRTCIVIIEIETGDEKQDVGVVVDSVSEVLEIPRTEVEQAPSFGAKIRADFIRGMGKINGKFVIILAVNHVLSIDEMAMLGQAGGAEPEILAPV